MDYGIYSSVGKGKYCRGMPAGRWGTQNLSFGKPEDQAAYVGWSKICFWSVHVRVHMFYNTA